MRINFSQGLTGTSHPHEEHSPLEKTKSASSGGGDTLFVGNLSFDTEEAAIEQFFEECGQISEVRIVTSYDGRSKGFAYVQFASAEAAKKALGLNGQELDGRPVRLDLSDGARGSGGSGSRGSGRGGRGGRGGFRGGY